MWLVNFFFFRGDDQFYPTSNTLIAGSHYPTDAALDKLQDDITAQ